MHSLWAHHALALRFAAQLWPAGAVHTDTDVILNGAFLTHAALVEPTPLVRIGEASAAWPAQTRSPQRFITVLLTRVVRIDTVPHSSRLDVWVDARFDKCRPNFAAARLVGRVSAHRHPRMLLHPVSGDSRGLVRLPHDLTTGDLIAVPCEGATPLFDVRTGTPPVDHARGDAADPGEDDPSAPCRK
ncbi:hypothetical protein [Mycetocola zhadangensis]|uniref:hypothetical protein n=1 Tax=Mycetocola zhadangensis TaxID=1164595 RepID=UPI0011C37ABB|nr:hypothetical protein [Mycetocola zhadangensis]